MKQLLCSVSYTVMRLRRTFEITPAGGFTCMWCNADRIPLIPCFNQVLQQQVLKTGKFQPQIGVYMYLQFHHIYMAMTTHKVHIITLIHSWCLYHLCISKTIMRKRVVCLSQQNRCHGVVWTTHSCCHTIHITIIVMLPMGKVMFM